ncbi:winged helix-turn-helix domain-containing protein [Pseudoduganella umbonata]|nr:winged helix-turn-helix domain-containing protein [Pseudoduganella umbonata]MBB3225172.1 DNA-binding winged helix-turn-helix (wHTH) protein [Pseudoduganella umbonata]
METASFETLAFLDFELTLARRQLLRDGVPVAVGGRALELLAQLAGHPGQVLENRVLMRAVWPRTVVEEVNLRVQIAALRKLLGGDGHCPYIVNYAGRGYCFTAPVTRLVPPGLQPVPTQPVPLQSLPAQPAAGQTRLRPAAADRRPDQPIILA